MLRARITSEGFPDFTAEGEDITDIWLEVEKRNDADKPRDFTLAWIHEHTPRLDDDVHTWLKSWANFNFSTSTTPREAIQKMIAEYRDYADEGKALRP